MLHPPYEANFYYFLWLILNIFISLLCSFILFYVISFSITSNYYEKIDFPSLQELNDQLLHWIPLSYNKKWRIIDSCNGILLWEPLCIVFSSFPYNSIKSSSFLSNCNLSDLISVFIDPLEIAEWNTFFNNIKKPSISSAFLCETKDESKEYIFCSIPRFIFGLKFGNYSSKFSIIWQVYEHSALIVYKPNDHTLLGYYCVLFLVTPVTKTQVSSMITVISIGSTSCRFSYLTNHCLTNLICSLREFIKMKINGVFSSTLISKIPFIHPDIFEISDNDNYLNSSQNVIDLDLSTDKNQKTNSYLNSKNNVRYFVQHATAHNFIDQINNHLLNILGNYTAKDDKGWNFVTINKGVEIWKKDSKDRNNPILTVRGSTKVNAPSEFVCRFISDERNTPLLDEMFDNAPIIETINFHTELRNLRFKTIWPIKRRDFCCILVGLAVDPFRYAVLCLSVNDSRCPPNKDYIRGCVNAGYIISQDPKDSKFSYVTYVLQLDLKGYIPTFAVNKVMSQQPLVVEAVRRYSEQFYFNQIDPTINFYLLTLDRIPPPPLESHVVSSENDANYTDINDISISNLMAIDDKYQREKSQSLSNLMNVMTDYVISDENFQSQNDERIVVDDSQSKMNNYNNPDIFNYITIANQLIISVQEEIKEALLAPIDFGNKDDQNTHILNTKWHFIDFDKEIIIMNKALPKNTYGFLGMGLINQEPIKVFNILKNPNNRFIYDNMLKSLNIVQDFGNGMYILKMKHETNRCLVKQSRQTCILIYEKKLADKYLIVSKSITNESINQTNDEKKFNIIHGGWIIEKRNKENESFSKVYYVILIQMDDEPQFFINSLVKKQPLCIAHVREYMKNII